MTQYVYSMQLLFLSTHNKTWCCNKVRQEAHKDNKSY